MGLTDFVNGSRTETSFRAADGASVRYRELRQDATAGGKTARVRVQRVGRAPQSPSTDLGRARARHCEARDRRGGQAMMRWRRVSTIAALSLLASATTAYAECAWVLWYRVTEYRDGEATEAPFDAGEAHPTLAACQGVLQERLTEWALVEATNPDLKTTTRPTFVLVQDKNSLKAKESAPTAASPTPWTRVDRR